jgi:hypothetical protein
MPRSRQPHIGTTTTSTHSNTSTENSQALPVVAPPPPREPEDKYIKRQHHQTPSHICRSLFRFVKASRTNSIFCALFVIWLLGCVVYSLPFKPRQHTFRGIKADDGLKPLVDPPVPRHGNIVLESSDQFVFEDFTQDPNLQAIFEFKTKTLAVLIVGLESSGR